MSEEHELLFTVTDPRGRFVVCTQDCWRDHVLVNHPYMDGLEEKVQAAITDPLLGCIYQDAGRADRQIYYGRLTGKDFYLKVVVRFSPDERGELITAFFSSASKTGEVWIWPKSSV